MEKSKAPTHTSFNKYPARKLGFVEQTNSRTWLSSNLRLSRLIHSTTLKSMDIAPKSRKGDWEVVRVETYTPDVPMGEFDMVVICYCKYNPINAPLKPMPERQVSVDSFGGDEEAYKRWLESEKQPAKV